MIFASHPTVKVAISTELDKSKMLPPIYKPRSVVSGVAVIEAGQDLTSSRFFISLEWWTEGKGQSDRRIVARATLFEGKLWAASPQEVVFNLPLPDQPWSYEGELIKIRWDIVVSMETRFSQRVICCKEITVAL